MYANLVKAPRGRHRRTYPDDFKTQVVAACLQPGVGEDISEQLDVEPARFFVHRHIRPQYACQRCETVTAAPVPASLIDGGLAAPGLHAWILIQKYLDHLPLYRIEKISERHGAPIARSTLAQWVGQLGLALQPLVDRLSTLLKRGQVLHADETPVQQLDPGQGKTRRAYLWAYRSNELEGAAPIVVFDYQTSRSGQHARDFLQGWQGRLMVDDYGGYKELFRQGVTELAGLAHCRRKFFDLHAAHPHPVAEEALRRIAELYAIEAQARDADAAVRLALRQQEALPRLGDLHGWLCAKRRVAAVERDWPVPSITASNAGQRSCAMWKVASCPSTITPLRMPSGRFAWAGAIGSSWAPNGQASALRPSRACWPPPASMDWNPTPGCGLPWRNSRPGPTAESMSCYRWAAG
ncbi:MAG: IS66 family transposase [Zoogloea sp.]|nr:MAG: IS66 family transposase [Zoogloea sp.]